MKDLQPAGINDDMPIGSEFDGITDEQQVSANEGVMGISPDWDV